MSGYVVVICIMLIMFVGLAIFVVQADVDERRFLAEHPIEDEADPVNDFPDLSADEFFEPEPVETEETGIDESRDDKLSA